MNLEDTDTVPVEIVSLSLSSVEPIEVTYDGGTASSFFHLFATLDPAQAQRTGQMSLTRTGNSAGVLDATLPVSFALRFENTNPALPSPAAPLTDFVEFQITDNLFHVILEPEASPERGDMNGDGFINVFDIGLFVLALLDPDAYMQQTGFEAPS